MHGSISLHGLRPTDLQRKPARYIEVCLRSRQEKLYHLGIRGRISRSTIADANEKRDWRIYADFCHILISKARNLYADEDFGVELADTAYALDSTTIDLCLALFPWASFRKHKAAVKMQTLLDIRGNIPSFIEITSGSVHDVNILDVLVPEIISILWIATTWISTGSTTLRNSFLSS